MRERLKTSLRELDKQVAWIFLTSVIAQTAFWYFARVPFLEDKLGALEGASAWRQIVPTLVHWGASFVLLAVTSILVIKLPLKGQLKDYGLRLGDRRLGIRGALVSYVVFALPIVLGGAGMADVGAEYPLSKAAATSWTTFAGYSALYGIYYVSWELHFRGFILQGLARTLGAWPAIFAQTVPSVLIHAGKPPGEAFGAILAGVVWGWLALETRSILWPLAAHWALGVTNDLVMSLHFHGLGG